MCQRGLGIDGLGDHLGREARIGAPHFQLLCQRDVPRQAEQSAVVIKELQVLAGIKAIEQRAHTGQRAHVLQIRDADLQATKDPIERVVALDHYLDERQARRGEFPEVIEALTRHVSLTQQLEVRRTDAGFAAEVIAKPIDSRTTLAHGTIDSSLFEAANDAGLSDITVLKLAKIFGSEIDFVLGLRAGDQFAVAYERIHQDGKYVKDGEILAARFINQGREYVAVRYLRPDGVVGYYSPAGRSMQKAFLRAPLEFQRISSGFSSARLHPILNTIRAHQGTDYAAPLGTPVYAAGSGRINYRGVKGGYGNVIQIDHGQGIETLYGHLSRFAAMKAGSQVQQGETIGYVGMTGLATGPHLHFEFHINGRFVDPQRVKLPDASPLDANLREDFERSSTPLLESLGVR